MLLKIITSNAIIRYMKNFDTISFSIISILLIQLGFLISTEARFSRIEKKIDEYFAPINDVELPKWEEQ